MSHLVPEKRLDKTGKLVTRHVKMESTSGSAGSPLPPPSIAQDSTDKVVLPEQKVTPMTAADFEMISDVLDSCGKDGYDVMSVSQYIRDGDLNSLRFFKKHVNEQSISMMVDVLQNTSELFHKYPPEDRETTLEAHLKVASSGDFEYYDIWGSPSHEEVLRLIHNNADQVESILNYIRTRGVDPEGVRNYLSNDVAPIREGTL